MAFANAMDSRIIGENGAPSLATTGSKLLDLHTALVRGLSTSALEGLFAAALKEAITVEAKADFVILASSRPGTLATARASGVSSMSCCG